jgi:hypothetical protein
MNNCVILVAVSVACRDLVPSPAFRTRQYF